MSTPAQPRTMLDICQQFPCLPEVKMLAEQYAKASDFIAVLRKEQMSPEAVQALARFLPKEKAVEWAAQSARLAGERTGDVSPQELTALAAAETWAAHPSAANRAAAAGAATDLPATSPAGWAAQAAAFAEGVEVPADADPMPSNEGLTAHFAAGSVLLAAAKTAPDGLPEIPEGTVPALSQTLDDALVQAIEPTLSAPKPPDLTPQQRAAATTYLDPFLDLGIALAQTVPGWV